MKSTPMLLMLFAILGFGAEFAQAQIVPAPGAPRAPRPTLSPYLNLLDRTNSPGFNYYNRVRPRQAFEDYRQIHSQNLQSIEKQVDQNRQAILQSENSQLTPTGHHVRFMDLGGYFGSGPKAGGLGGGPIGRR